LLFDLKNKRGMSMLELKGKYNEAKVFTDVVDEASISQIILLLNQEFTSGSKIRMMPDVHAGAGCTVGTTMTITDKAVPNLVGVDIGCGIETIRIKEKHMELQKLDKLIYERIPSGFSVREKTHRYFDSFPLEELFCYKKINPLRAEKSLGTLGGGNHFIEADKDEEGNIYLVIHSGSRHLGLEVANYYQEEGYQALCPAPQGQSKIPRTLAYVEGELFKNYLHDMKLVQRFAELNRQAMMDELVKGMKLHVVEQFTTVHNYIDTEAMVLRKGAVSAKAGETLLIPINMRDGSLICTGKGNDDWNQSAPHGAGRLMSRSAAKQSFTVSEFKKQMKGIFTTSVSQETLDECPMAYKGMEDIIGNIKETAEITRRLQPIYNFKAGKE
jgi:tRNA-splicing ligase RtcB